MKRLSRKTTIVGLCLVAVLVIWAGFALVACNEEQVETEEQVAHETLERYEYQGCVIMVNYPADAPGTSYVWLDTDLQPLILTEIVELTVGGEYLITVDGNGELISIEQIK